MGRVALLAPVGDSRAARLGDRLVAALAEHVREGEAFDVLRVWSRGEARELRARELERVAVVVTNETCCGFVLDTLRTLGGTALVDSWALFELTRAARPRIAEPGLLGALEALRCGGLADVRRRRAFLSGQREVPVANRGVVRLADAFVVPSAELARQIREERNAATPVGVLDWPGEEAPEEEWRTWAAHSAQLIDAMPSHRTNRQSLIQSAIEGSDRARKEREAGQ